VFYDFIKNGLDIDCPAEYIARTLFNRLLREKQSGFSIADMAATIESISPNPMSCFTGVNSSSLTLPGITNGKHASKRHWETGSMNPLRNRSESPLKNACREAVLICVAAVAIGLLVNLLRPQGIDLINHGNADNHLSASPEIEGASPITLAEAFEKLKNSRAVFIDARSEYDFKAGHIKTALNLQEKNLDIWMPDFFEKTTPETLLITYCSGPRCHLAESVAVKLYELGYFNVRYMSAGGKAWLASIYPGE
jgi:rhodanese-related sulfurtransferase